MQIGPAANRCRAVSMPGSGISDCMTMQAPKTILAPCDQPVHELCNKYVTEALLRPCITAKPQVRGGTTDESACTPGSVPRGALRRGRERRPSISDHRCRWPPAVYPQARAGRPRTPAQPPSGLGDLLTLLRVGFTEPPQSPGALVRSYRTVSPLPVPTRVGAGGLFSVALSRGSPRVGVTHHPAL